MSDTGNVLVYKQGISHIQPLMTTRKTVKYIIYEIVYFPFQIHENSINPNRRMLSVWLKIPCFVVGIG